MTSSRKLFHVTMTLDIDMMVLAETGEQARTSAEDNWPEEVRNAGLTPSLVSVREILNREQARFWAGDDGTPYGVAGERYERGCSSPQLTIAEYLEAAGAVPSQAK